MTTFDLSTFADSYARDSYARQFNQLQTATGIDPIEIIHSFYGMTSDGTQFELARIVCTETSLDSRIGKLNFQIMGVNGVPQTILDLSTDGVAIGGDISVDGGSTTLSTSSIEVQDINVILANTATASSQLDGGGIILGTTDSGTKTILYDITEDRWDLNSSINLTAGEHLSIGGTDVLLDSTGLYFGGVAITAGSLTLSPDVVLDSEGLTIGDISLYPDTGLLVGNVISVTTDGISLGALTSDPILVSTSGITLGSVDPVTITSTGIALGSALTLTATGGLEIGNTISVSTDGLTLGTVSIDDTGMTIGDTISLTVADGLAVGDDVLINSSGLSLGASGSDQVIINSEGLQVGSDLSLTVTGGLEISDDVSISSSGIQLGNVDPVIINSTGLTLGADLSLTVADGLSIGTTVELNEDGLNLGGNLVVLNTTGLTVGTNLSLTEASGLVIGTNVTLNEDGLDMGNVSLNATGLDLGNLSVTESGGVILGSDASFTTTALTIGSSDPMVLNQTSLSFGDTVFGSSSLVMGNVTITETEMSVSPSVTIDGAGITIGSNTLTEDSLTFGSAGNVVISSSGLYLDDADAAVYFGPNNEWKLEFDAESESLLFQFWDSASSEYISKLELRNST